MITYGDPEYQILAWGMGHVCDEGIPIGGIYMSSSVTGSSAVWPVQISTPREVADAHGGIEHMRGHLGVPRILEANQLCWFTDRTPHEALPVEAPKHNPGAEFVYRQFFPLVAGPISSGIPSTTPQTLLGCCRTHQSQTRTSLLTDIGAVVRLAGLVIGSVETQSGAS
jgi:hypothetical protein